MKWRPIGTAPRDESYIMLAGPSGYTGTPLRVEVGFWDGKRWRNHSNDHFTDGGAEPTLWHPLIEIPAPEDSVYAEDLLSQVRGVRVDGSSVVITVKGGNGAARELCSKLVKLLDVASWYWRTSK
jgi:hypothetical protein